MLGSGDNLTVLEANKMFELRKHKNFPIFLSSQALVLVPHMSHLVKLSLPNIYPFAIRGFRDKQFC